MTKSTLRRFFAILSTNYLVSSKSWLGTHFRTGSGKVNNLLSIGPHYAIFGNPAAVTLAQERSYW
jgi:hypothetical protein